MSHAIGISLERILNKVFPDWSPRWSNWYPRNRPYSNQVPGSNLGESAFFLTFVPGSVKRKS